MAKDVVTRVDYWHTTVPDTPGAANAVLQKLADRKVDLLAFLAFPVAGGTSQLDLVPTTPASFERAAAAAGVPLSSKKQALLVHGADRPGALAEHTAKLARHGVNVTAGTAVATPGGGYGFLVWVPSGSIEKAAKALAG
jgi:prephenate dehydratase